MTHQWAWVRMRSKQDRSRFLLILLHLTPFAAGIAGGIKLSSFWWGIGLYGVASFALLLLALAQTKPSTG